MSFSNSTPAISDLDNLDQKCSELLKKQRILFIKDSMHLVNDIETAEHLLLRHIHENQRLQFILMYLRKIKNLNELDRIGIFLSVADREKIKEKYNAYLKSVDYLDFILSSIPKKQRVFTIAKHLANINNVADVEHILLKHIPATQSLQFLLLCREKIKTFSELTQLQNLLSLKDREIFDKAYQKYVSTIAASTFLPFSSIENLSDALKTINNEMVRIAVATSLIPYINNASALIKGFFPAFPFVEGRYLLAKQYSYKIKTAEELNAILIALENEQRVKFAMDNINHIANLDHLHSIKALLPLKDQFHFQKQAEEYINHLANAFFAKKNDIKTFEDLVSLLRAAPKIISHVIVSNHVDLITTARDLGDISWFIPSMTLYALTKQLGHLIKTADDASHLLSDLPKENRIEFANLYKDKINSHYQLDVFLRELKDTGYNLLSLAQHHAKLITSAYELKYTLYCLPENKRLGFIKSNLHLIKTSDDVNAILRTLPKTDRVALALDLDYVIKDAEDLTSLTTHFVSLPDSMQLINKHKNKIKDYASLKSLLLDSMPTNMKTAEFVAQFMHLVDDAIKVQEVSYLLNKNEGYKFISLYAKAKRESQLAIGNACSPQLLEKLVTDQTSLPPYWPWEEKSNDAAAVTQALTNGFFNLNQDLPKESNGIKAISSDALAKINSSLLALSGKLPYISDYGHCKKNEILTAAKEVWILLKEQGSLSGKYPTANKQPETLIEAAAIFSQAAFLVAIQDANELKKLTNDKDKHSWFRPVSAFQRMSDCCLNMGNGTKMWRFYNTGKDMFKQPPFTNKGSRKTLDLMREVWVQFNKHKANILNRELLPVRCDLARTKNRFEREHENLFNTFFEKQFLSEMLIDADKKRLTDNIPNLRKAMIEKLVEIHSIIRPTTQMQVTNHLQNLKIAWENFVLLTGIDSQYVKSNTLSATEIQNRLDMYYRPENSKDFFQRMKDISRELKIDVSEIEAIESSIEQIVKHLQKIGAESGVQSIREVLLLTEDTDKLPKALKTQVPDSKIELPSLSANKNSNYNGPTLFSKPGQQTTARIKPSDHQESTIDYKY